MGTSVVPRLLPSFSFISDVPDLLRDQLQTTLGTGYTLGRELGGGGMSRVYVARDEALGRDVVVKVLAPELAEGLSAERFARVVCARRCSRTAYRSLSPPASAIRSPP